MTKIKHNHQIWFINTYGTSLTKGGGFEFWDNKKLKEYYSQTEPDIPQFQFNFSWPGQLQLLVGRSIVTNYAKSGYGNETLIKYAYKRYFGKK